MSASKIFLGVMVIFVIFVSACAKTSITPGSAETSKEEAPGIIPTIACYKDSDCGQTSFRDFCYQRSAVYRETIIRHCSNAGTANAACTSEKTQKIYQDCSSKEICEDGRCIPAPPPCIDTDDGIDEFTSGKVKFGVKDYSDGCINTSVLMEYYCAKNGSVAQQEIACDSGCSLDVCRE